MTARRRIIRSLAAMGIASAALLAPTAATAAEPAAPVAADVDDFSYASWDARYDVGLDDEGRARLHVTETLVATFPDFDQNKGPVRGLATSYRGAGLDTRVLSISDGDGNPVPYETEEDDDVLYLVIGNEYVHGPTTYVIEYEMRDVVLAADSGVDEFYWDLLPLDSTQDIGGFHAEIAFDAELSRNLTGATRCYSGQEGEAESCELSGPEQHDGGAVFTVESGARPAGDGVTVAIGLEPGSVVQPRARIADPVADVVPMVLGGSGLALSAGAWILVGALQKRRRRGTGIVVAQYEVPDSLPPLVAGPLIPGSKAVLPAEIVHLAVRGALRIEEPDGPDEQPTLRRLPSGSARDPLDADALEALFLDADADGVMQLPEASEDFSTRMGALAQSGVDAAEKRGYTTKARSRGAMILQWFAIAATLVGLGLAIWGAASGRQSALPGLLVASIGTAAVLFSCLFTFSRHVVLTPSGALVHEHLEGVREFIRVAEADRIRMLQSYRGAERRQDGAADVIVLYERLLPYAMLFGEEKQWGKALETAYASEDRAASWMGDPATPFLALHLATFAGVANASATYSAPSAGSSSGAGGSFGGGYSGGGGGGGFSGGH